MTAEFPVPSAFGHFTDDDVSARRLPERAGASDRENVLYVLAFESGLTKVGRSAAPAKRVGRHVRDVQRFTGARLADGWLSSPHANFLDTESALVAHGQSLAARVEGAEYLFGADFTALVEFAEQLDLLPPIEGPVYLPPALFGVTNPDRAVDSEPVSLPPPLRPESDDELLPAVRALAAALGKSVADVAEMSWLDLYELALETRAETYRHELRRQFLMVQSEAYANERFDLTEPVISYETWLRLRTEPLGAQLVLVEPAS